MAAKTVSVEAAWAAIEESIMRANGDADYEPSLSAADSEEEASTNDKSSDDQQDQRIMFLLQCNNAMYTRNATPAAAKQAAAPSILTVLAPSSKAFWTFKETEGNRS